MSRGNGLGGRFRRDDAPTAAPSVPPEPVEELGPDPLRDEMLLYPDLREMADAVDRRDWPAVRAYIEHMPTADDRCWAAAQFAERSGADAVLRAALAADPSDDLAAALTGHRLIAAAWDVRGGGRASTVSQEQFDRFHDLLRQADATFQDVLARDPANLFAGTGRLTSGRGLQVGLGEVIRRYELLERHYPHLWAAQGPLLQQLVPKWGGDWPRAWEFAVRCAQAAPPGSPCAVQVVWYHLEQWIELADDAPAGSPQADRLAHPYFTQPQVHADLVRAAEASVLNPAYRRPRGWEGIDGAFAMCFALAGDLPRAAVHFAALDNRMAEAPWNYLPRRTLVYRQMRARALRVAGAPPSVLAAPEPPEPVPGPAPAQYRPAAHTVSVRARTDDLAGYDKAIKPNPDVLRAYAPLRELRRCTGALDWAGVVGVLAQLTPEELPRALQNLETVPEAEGLAAKAAADHPEDPTAVALLGALKGIRGWRLRGDGAETHVYMTQLREADALLGDVWAAAPGNPMAGIQRLSTGRGLQLPFGELKRRYDQLAVHHPHLYAAQYLLLLSELPRWTGTWERAFRWARRCAADSPAGSACATGLAEVHIARWSALENDGVGYFLQPEVRLELERAADHSVLNPSYVRRVGWVEWHSAFALALSLGESYERAERLFDDLDNILAGAWVDNFTDPAREFYRWRTRARRELAG